MQTGVLVDVEDVLEHVILHAPDSVTLLVLDHVQVIVRVVATITAQEDAITSVLTEPELMHPMAVLRAHHTVLHPVVLHVLVVLALVYPKIVQLLHIVPHVAVAVWALVKPIPVWDVMILVSVLAVKLAIKTAKVIVRQNANLLAV